MGLITQLQRRTVVRIALHQHADKVFEEYDGKAARFQHALAMSKEQGSLKSGNTDRMYQNERMSSIHIQPGSLFYGHYLYCSDLS